ncbi:Endonuclease/exonuclease/phosphatase [Gossypium australe]|uniref:Endonuclease/exonuclease/phosphatase n=1 Tax=Gossypium australe TaxID=47621 RepID=A0A5B6W8G2_9ROSI|nr:Endonuclease/exonuclease/phosphatase [Gossypium australe]
MSGTLPTVDFATGANNSGSTSGIRRATKKARTKPKCEIQLMDLENDFYLVRFQDESDYNKVLVGGPWTVGPVVKLDVQTDCTHNGRFVRLAVCVDLRKPLVSKVRINGRL